MTLSIEQQKQAIRLAEEGNKVSSIAQQIGASPRTLRRWLIRGGAPGCSEVRYKEFYYLFNEAQARHEAKLVRNVARLADMEGSLKANQYLLEKVHGWGDSAVEERVVRRVLEYLVGKLDPALFEEVLQDVEAGAFQG
jgi:transposase-like protein